MASRQAPLLPMRTCLWRGRGWYRGSPGPPRPSILLKPTWAKGEWSQAPLSWHVPLAPRPGSRPAAPDPPSHSTQWTPVSAILR